MGSDAGCRLVLDGFEGPLDLLLHLIERQKVAIDEVSLVAVTDQYLEYLAGMGQFDIEVASEFLLVAATLLKIKSQALLPARRQEPEAEQLTDEMKKNLVDQLIEYKCYKQIGQWLEECGERRGRQVTRPPLVLPVEYVLPRGLDVRLLTQAAAMIWQRQTRRMPLTIDREQFSVRAKIRQIAALLRDHRRELSLSQCLEDSQSRGELVATFLAVLELIRLRRVTVRQERAFAEIYLRWRPTNKQGKTETEDETY
ncbi:MAG: segregation/condensation protein A [Negativicutes bacterium]|nr:segregation/condensation protein A [Negativicutes bacterium]